MEKNKKQFWIIVAISYSVLLATALILGLFSTTIAGMEWNWGLAMFLALVLYTIASLHKIGPSDIGVRLLFGDAVDQVESGLTFVPYGIFTLQVFSNLIQQAELPAEPEKIYRGNNEDKDGKNVPEGKYAPIRIIFGKPEEANTTDPYDQRMSAEVTPVIRYHIVDAIKFIQTIGNWDRARVQIEDAVVSTLNEELSLMTPAKALTKLAGDNGINQKMHYAIDKLLKSWGIDLESIRLKPFGFSHELNEAVLEVPKAQRKKEAGIIEAEGLKKVTILKGEGAGAAKKAELDGETDGRKRMASELGVDGASILAAETARAITSNPGQKTIIAGSSGFSELATIGSVLGETLKKEG